MHCSVRGCISKKQTGNGIIFFRFPTKQQQKEQWLKILNIPFLDSPNNAFVCCKHFEQKYFKTNNGNLILLPGAVPTKNRTYTNIARKLIPIQPKPSPILQTNQNILIKPVPIVVVPFQNNTIATSSNFKTSINQNFAKLLQTPQVQVVKTNDERKTNDDRETNESAFVSSVPIGEKIVEINNYEELDSSETESVQSINSDNNETTQNLSKLDESCYILVEDDNINSQDDAKIVASGVDIKELINDAKIAINSKLQEVKTPITYKGRRWRTNYIGDCVFEDMENPIIRKHHWTLALNVIQKLRNKVKILEQKSRRLQKRLTSAKSVITQLKQNNVQQIESDSS